MNSDPRRSVASNNTQPNPTIDHEPPRHGEAAESTNLLSLISFSYDILAASLIKVTTL